MSRTAVLLITGFGDEAVLAAIVTVMVVDVVLRVSRTALLAAIAPNAHEKSIGAERRDDQIA